jgi:hypothetical protein
VVAAAGLPGTAVGAALAPTGAAAAGASLGLDLNVMHRLQHHIHVFSCMFNHISQYLSTRMQQTAVSTTATRTAAVPGLHMGRGWRCRGTVALCNRCSRARHRCGWCYSGIIRLACQELGTSNKYDIQNM